MNGKIYPRLFGESFKHVFNDSIDLSCQHISFILSIFFSPMLLYCEDIHCITLPVHLILYLILDRFTYVVLDYWHTRQVLQKVLTRTYLYNILTSIIYLHCGFQLFNDCNIDPWTKWMKETYDKMICNEIKRRNRTSNEEEGMDEYWEEAYDFLLKNIPVEM